MAASSIYSCRTLQWMIAVRKVEKGMEIIDGVLSCEMDLLK